ncbi:MAG: sigma-70 family RNA polymerase sigma factor [Planctomycetota bacterium]
MTRLETGRRGDWEAEARMVRLHLRSLGARAEEAEDLAQQVLLAAVSAGLPEPPARAAWLRETARRQWLSQCGKEGRRAEILRGEAAEAVWRRMVPGDRPEDFLEALRLCLEGLAPRARRIVEAHHRERRPLAEIAAAEGMTRTAVETALHRARRALRECIERRVEE